MKRLIRTKIQEGAAIPENYEIIQVIKRELTGITNYRKEYALVVYAIETKEHRELRKRELKEE